MASKIIALGEQESGEYEYLLAGELLGSREKKKHHSDYINPTVAGAPFQARKANYLIGVFVCLFKLQ